MILRCSQDVHYQSFSEDGGESWSPPEPSRFYGTLTMPRIGRLSDGRLLFIWNNTTPLPELSPENPVKRGLPETAKDGTWEDVFTNRAVLHAAISEDDGHTWRGFRELYLDPRRNAPDYAESGGIDHSVHQSQFLELEQGKILVSFGQHPLHRAMVVFDPGWLYETSRKSDFSMGLEDWCVHKFIAEIRGHCSYNRKTGASLVEHPDDPSRKVLRIRRPSDPELLVENDGAVWNFPSGEKGTLVTRVLLPGGSQGARISLVDRWFNPVDTNVYRSAMYSVELVPGQKVGILHHHERPVPMNEPLNNRNQTVRTGDEMPETGYETLTLPPDTWQTLRFEWDGLADPSRDPCRLSINDSADPVQLSLQRTSLNGISYIHIISSAGTGDPDGLLLESVEATLNP
jgi:hypothetical protein